MNDLFSPRRFGKLFVKHTADHYRSYLMSVAVVAGVLILGGIFFAYMVKGFLDPGAQQVMFIFLYTLAGTIFTSTIFSDLGDKRKAISALMLPATALEKFLVAWVWSYLIFSVIFTTLFYFVLVVVIRAQAFRGNPEQMMVFFNVKMLILFVLFSLLHSIALFGAIVFEKLHFIKTAFCFFVILGLLILLNTLWVGALTHRNVAPVLPFSFMGFREEDRFYNVGVKPDQTGWVTWVVLALALFFWVAAYFRLKEKRV